MRRYILSLFIFILLSNVGYTQDPTWKVNEGAFQQTETLICKLSINGVMLESPNDMVGAFIGGECRGVSKPTYIASLNKYLTYLTVFSNTQGDTITFKLFNSKTGQVVDAVNKLAFKINEHIGSAFQTYRISSTKLSSESKLLSFGFSNASVDSIRVETNVTTGEKTNVYFIPQNTNKTSLVPTFSVSAAANVYVLEKPVVSGVTNFDFTTDKNFQIVSEDESSLTNFNVSVRNSISCADSSKYAPVITKDISGNLNSSVNYNNIWYKDGQVIIDTGKSIKPTASGLFKVKTKFGYCLSSFSAPYYFLITDLINIDNGQFIKVNPNPFKQYFTLDFSLNIYQKLNIKLISLTTGNIVFDKYNVYSGSVLQPNNLLPGLYVCMVYSADGKLNYQFKLMKI
ncbi:MAG: hypothetical protein RI940_443 [Bacteroidota bacterium]